MHQHQIHVMFCEKGRDASKESFDPCQPARTAQADMGQNFPLSANFMHVEGPVHIMTRSVVKKKKCRLCKFK